MKNLMTDSRKKALPVMSLLSAGLIISQIKGNSSAVYALLAVDSAALFIFLFLPAALFPLRKGFDLIVKGLSFIFTSILIFILQCFIFFMIRIVLTVFRVNIFDMRFKSREDSYYRKADNRWREHLDEPF